MEEKWLFFFRNAFEFLALIEYRSIYIMYIYSEWEEKRDCVCVFKRGHFLNFKGQNRILFRRERDRAFKKKKKNVRGASSISSDSQSSKWHSVHLVYVLWLYIKKADVISTLGSHNTLIPLHGTPSKVIFRTLRILMSMMIDLFIHQWREIFIWTMPSDQTTPRARPIFKFVLWLDTIKAVTSQFVPIIKCRKKKMMNREILSEL